MNLQKQAVTAIQTIGTNAIPALLRMLNARDSNLKLAHLLQKQHLINIKLTTADASHSRAIFGFMALASEGKTAVPDLLQIYIERRPGPHDNPAAIAQIFALMGPAAADAVPRLIEATSGTNSTDRFNATWVLAQIHARPDLAIPALSSCLRDPDDQVRGMAALSLVDFGTNARSAVPELTRLLSDPNTIVRQDAAYALQKIDPEAAAQAGVK